jgi:DeoR family suf operon transcriptional repressor
VTLPPPAATTATNGAESEAASDRLLAHLPPARQTMLSCLKASGEATAEDLADALGATVSAARQHLRPLVDEGLVAFREVRSGPGRPRRLYRLAAAAEGLFPKRYGQLTNQLLGFIDEADTGLVSRAFERRRDARVAAAEPRLAGADLEGRVRELTRILDEDGYLAECERRDDGSWLIVEHNCAVLDVAMRYREACSSELAFLRAVLPDADVERVSHIVNGAHQCAYVVTRRSGTGARRGR